MLIRTVCTLVWAVKHTYGLDASLVDPSVMSTGTVHVIPAALGHLSLITQCTCIPGVVITNMGIIDSLTTKSSV